MNNDASRRRRAKSFRLIAYPTSVALATWRGSPDSVNPYVGRREPSKGSYKRSTEVYPAGWARDANRCGLHPRGWSACGSNAATVVGSAMGMADPVEVGIQSGLGGPYVPRQPGRSINER